MMRIFLLLLLICLGANAREGFISRVLSPGPVMAGHAKFENQCTTCHEVGSGVSPAKCLSCHENIKIAVDSKHGYHGMLTNSCIHCHTEHAGRSSDSTVFPVKNFDHKALTGFVLDGKHADTKCVACHNEKREQKLTRKKDTHFFGAKTTCVGCHAKDDVHHFAADFKKTSCNECHSTKTWKKETVFNHNKDTSFPLDGMHARTKCAACHLPNGNDKTAVYKWLGDKPVACITCHANVHKDQFGPTTNAKSCAECHNTKSFSERLPFDHDHTAYPLRGKHAELKCADCHKPTAESFPGHKSHPHFKDQFRFPELAAKDCATCHKDIHQGQLGNKCETCHSNTTWKPATFNHSKQSRFALNGAHAQLDCKSCHTTEQPATAKTPALMHFKPISPECVTCHKDPHHGDVGPQCQQCHQETKWKPLANYHKNFRLLGRHNSLECAECHKNGQNLNNLGAQCLACHQKDDVHRGTLPKCGDCHRQDLWEDPRFKHSMSRFPLRGIHRTLDCNECHARGIYQGLPSRCSDCHLNNAMGVAAHPNPVPVYQNCSQCHNQFSFK